MSPSTTDPASPAAGPARPAPHDPHGAGARPGARHLRRRDDRARRAVRGRRRRRLVLDEQPPDAARRRRGRARGRRLAARQPGQGHHRRPRRGRQERLHERRRRRRGHARPTTSKNPRRIKVAITGPGGHPVRAGRRHQLLARGARTAKADYVLPVPMGSPQNYYGVGFYEGPGLAHVGRDRPHVVRRAVVGPRVHREPRDRPRRRAASGRRPAARSRPR